LKIGFNDFGGENLDKAYLIINHRSGCSDTLDAAFHMS